MSLEIRLELVDLTDAIAYEFFMNNLETVIGDSLEDLKLTEKNPKLTEEDPELTDEKVLEVVESITLLASMAYNIAGKFKQVRAEFKKLQHNRI